MAYTYVLSKVEFIMSTTIPEVAGLFLEVFSTTQLPAAIADTSG